MNELYKELAIFKSCLGYKIKEINHDWPFFYTRKKKGLAGIFGKKETVTEIMSVMLAIIIIRKQYLEKGEEITNETLRNYVKSVLNDNNIMKEVIDVLTHFPGFNTRFHPGIAELPFERKNVYFVHNNKVWRIPDKYL